MNSRPITRGVLVLDTDVRELEPGLRGRNIGRDPEMGSDGLCASGRNQIPFTVLRREDRLRDRTVISSSA